MRKAGVLMDRERDVVIAARRLRKEYTVGENVVKALDGVDMEALRGEFVCIAGRSGSGKSTLLSLLAGLESPTEGEVEILGKRMDLMNERERIRFRKENIGFVFQSYNLMAQYTTLENVALPLMIRGVPEAERSELAKKALALVGLSEHAEHRPTELSGGQQQRVGIARAIITHPPIVFADEPTGNLDTKTSDEVMELLTSIFRKWNATFILVSHDPDMTRYTDRTIRLLDGRVVEDKFKEDTKND